MCRVIAFCLALVLSVTAIAAEIIGRVASVHDGNTITVIDASGKPFKVRLLGIDAPESGQAFGTRAKQNLSGFVNGQTVRIEYDQRDRYGRILGKVFAIAPCLRTPCPFVLDVNLAQVQAGMAWWDRSHAKDQTAQDKQAYELAEAQARDASRGLWAARDPVAPWKWRQKR